MNIFSISEPLMHVQTVGIGLTNLCNLNCPHCYSRKMIQKSLNSESIYNILKKIPNLKSINYGTGESILNNEFMNILDMVHEYGIKQALTTNGLTIDIMSDDDIRKLDDVDISIDFPDSEMHDTWRGKKGLFEKAIKAIEKSKKNDVNTSIVTCLMNNNYEYITKFKPILDKYDIMLRINIYKKAENGQDFSLNYDQFWDAMKNISKTFEIVSCSEPILSLVYDKVVGGSRCGESIRIHPDGEISSCVYVKDGKSIEEFSDKKKILPNHCQKCKFVDKCMGGCVGRRILDNRLYDTDRYCPMSQKKELPDFKFKDYKEKSEFVHSNYLCTMILR